MHHGSWYIYLGPESGAYRQVTLQAEHRLYGWLQRHGQGPISQRAWIGSARFDLPVEYTCAKLERDSYLQQWRWTSPVSWMPTRVISDDDPSPELVIRLMQSAGIDTSKRGVQEEAVALIGFVKEAANGIPPGGRQPGRWMFDGAGTKIGTFTLKGGNYGGPRVLFHKFAGYFLAIWLPGLLIIARRPLWRLAARQTGRWTVISAFFVSIATGAIAAVLLACTLDDYFYRAVIAVRTLGGVLVMVTCVISILAPIVLIFRRRRFLASSPKRQVLWGIVAPVGLLVLTACFMVVGLKSETTVLPFPVTPTVTLRFQGRQPNIDVEMGMSPSSRGDPSFGSGCGGGPGGLTFNYEYIWGRGHLHNPSWPVNDFVSSVGVQSVLKLSATSTVHQDRLKVTMTFTNSETVDFDVSGLSGVEITVDGTSVDAPARIRPGTHGIVINGRHELERED
jgi:hypothetical protein